MTELEGSKKKLNNIKKKEKSNKPKKIQESTKANEPEKKPDNEELQNRTSIIV